MTASPAHSYDSSNSERPMTVATFQVIASATARVGDGYRAEFSHK
jgi:hypothetical protein